ncbi:MAG: hypothetical protein H6592_00145 [Flavobacteriales bacterium]|nr:hypothetical protein [Flavobacteriales bacterium]
MRTLPPFADRAVHHHIEEALLHMDGFHGDSAMVHINAALGLITPDERPEEEHYLLCYRAEVLYYEGLFNAAMRDLNKAERLAHDLNDSTLIANAYNLKGLLHENVQDSKEALPYLRLALAWFPHHPASRYPISELYHIHGNMGSYLTTLGRTDSARHHLETSLRLASEARAQRAMAVAWWGLGNLDLRAGKPMVALEHYDRSWSIADAANDHDIGVDALVGRGLALAQAGRNSDAMQALARARAYLIEHRAQVGLVTQRNFARMAGHAYERIGELPEALDRLGEWHHIDSTITAQNIRTALSTQAMLLKADGDLELARIERQRVSDQLGYEQRRRRWLLLIGSLTVIGLSTLLLVNNARQRHRRRSAELEAQYAVQERTIAELRVREQVSRDLHDDLGVGLSALKLRSEMSLRQDPSSTNAPFLREQANAAGELITSMRDIIWALQDDQGSLDDLVAYISAHARQYLDAHGIILRAALDERWPAIQLTSQQRRNVFLIIKEALHNVVKHAGANRVDMRITWARGLVVEVVDDGQGLPADRSRRGNGSVNMAERARQMAANFEVSNAPDNRGVRVWLHVPLARNES